MLQVIGWILCLMLLVKSLELAGNKELGKVAELGMAAAFFGAIGFAIWLYPHGEEMRETVGAFAG